MRPSIRHTLLTVLIVLPGCAGCNRDEESGPADPAVSETEAVGASQSTASESREIIDPPLLVDVTAQSGIDFTYHNGEEAGHFAILESLGGGLAAVDFDLDGREDLYVTGGGEFGEENSIVGLPGSLWRNLGDVTFDDVSESSRSRGGRHYSHGVNRGDYDHDGFPDLLVTGYGGLELLHNLGDGTYESIDVEAAGLDDKLWSSSSAWGDLNGDSHLDLYVAHYVDWSFENHPFCHSGVPNQREVCPPKDFLGLPDALYYSNGDGTFREVASEVLNTRESDAPKDKSLGCVIADLDLDGDLEIYVTNDTVPSFLYRNEGNGTFTDHSRMSGTSLGDRATPNGSMGVDLYDHNLDGLPDIWVVNYESESSALYQNVGDLYFKHVSQPMGINAVGQVFVGWGTCCFDVDCDGDEDMFVSNGHVIRYPVNAGLRQLPLLFRNQFCSDPGEVFENVAPAIEGYMSEPHMGRGAVASDLDQDGDVDLAISHTNEPVAVLANETESGRHWLEVELFGTVSPRDAVGAVARVTTSEREFIRHLKGGGSYASSNSRILHFGLGEAEHVESIEISWPSGITQTLASPEINGLVQVVERE